MTTYIDEMNSIRYRLPHADRRAVQVVAEHYIGNNPPVPYAFRAFSRSGIMQTEEGLYDLNFRLRFADAPLGVVCCAYGLVWSDSERSIDLGLICYGPVRVFFNNALLYRSNAIDEVKKNHRVAIGATFQPGWNSLYVQAVHTTAGFGCQIGAEEGKVRILNILSPFRGRKGQAGWVFSEPQPPGSIGKPDEAAIPDYAQDEAESGIVWYPKTNWTAQQAQLPVCERLFGIRPGKKAWAWSKLRVKRSDDREIELIGMASGAIRIWAGGEELQLAADAARGPGAFRAAVRPGYGDHDVLVETGCGEMSWEWSLDVAAADTHAAWMMPYPVHGYGGNWFYLGPVGSEVSYPPGQLQSLNAVYDNGAGEQVYWQPDQPECRIRPYYENALLSNNWTTSGLTNFARWDYPLGVTMYGFPSINHQLVLVKMLDNCGSFGSSMLEAHKASPDPAFLAIGDAIADFMLNRLERRPDGAFYRICAGEYAENSMWADDLYMSTPFLKRYYELTGHEAALDEAADQFLLFRQYLYMPDQKIMSHVYDFKYGTATKVPWGRGNGWVIFSLSELLETLPDDHPKRTELLSFFNELCEGYAALQGDNGLWHQVLNDPDAYCEASCTAMFVYAFSRGAYKGWLHEPDRFIASALKGWEGLTRHAIDRHGNVHGVCSGSRYSFTPEYYKEELRTVTNDNHGIGIMLLAGVEVSKLADWLDKKE